RRLDGLADDPDPDLLVAVRWVQAFQNLARKEQRHTATGDDTFLDSGLGCVHAILDAVFALLNLDLAAAADTDNRYATRQLGQPLLQLLAVIIRCRLFDLRPDLVGAGDDVFFLTGAIDDRRVLLLDQHPLGAA